MTLKNNHNKFQRDVFIDTLFSYAKNNKKILLLSNDQGAIALDNFRKKIPEQYINVGISEQNIIGVAK
jgi:transketolase